MTAVVTSLAELIALRREWNALAGAAGGAIRSPLLDHDWIVAAARNCHAEGDLRIVTAWQDRQLIAAAPLAADPSRGRLALLGAVQLFEPGGWLARSRDAMRQLLDAVINLGEPIVLERVPVESWLVDELAARSRAGALTVQRQGGSSCWVATGEGRDACLSRMSARTRRTLSQAREGLERDAGAVRLVCEQPTTADGARTLLARFAAIEAAGWKGQNGSAIQSRPVLQAFFADYCETAAASGTLRMLTMTAGDEPIAMEIAVTAHGRVWALKTAYQERYHRHAPGLQLTQASIELAADARADAYEFLGAAESWQARWHPQRRDYALLAVYPGSVQGLKTIGADAWGYVRRWAEERGHTR